MEAVRQKIILGDYRILWAQYMDERIEKMQNLIRPNIDKTPL